MSTAATAGGSSPMEGPQAPEPEAPAEEKKSESRDYLIMESTQEGVWQEVKVVNATSADAAKKAIGEASLKEQARYVAVPKRYWQPERPKITKTTTISFG